MSATGGLPGRNSAERRGTRFGRVVLPAVQPDVEPRWLCWVVIFRQRDGVRLHRSIHRRIVSVNLLLARGPRRCAVSTDWRARCPGRAPSSSGRSRSVLMSSGNSSRMRPALAKTSTSPTRSGSARLAFACSTNCSICWLFVPICASSSGFGWIGGAAPPAAPAGAVARLLRSRQSHAKNRHCQTHHKCLHL